MDDLNGILPRECTPLAFLENETWHNNKGVILCNLFGFGSGRVGKGGDFWTPENELEPPNVDYPYEKDILDTNTGLYSNVEDEGTYLTMSPDDLGQSVSSLSTSSEYYNIESGQPPFIMEEQEYDDPGQWNMDSKANVENEEPNTQESTPKMDTNDVLIAYPVRTRQGSRNLPLVSPFSRNDEHSKQEAHLAYDRCTREWRIFWIDGEDALYKVFQSKKYGKDRAFGLAVDYANQLGRNIAQSCETQATVRSDRRSRTKYTRDYKKLKIHS